MLEMAATHVNALQLVNVKIRYAPNLTARRLGAEVMQIARNAVFVTFLMISVGFKASVVCVPADPLIAKQAVQDFVAAMVSMPITSVNSGAKASIQCPMVAASFQI